MEISLDRGSIERTGIERAPLMCISTYESQWRTSMMSGRAPPSTSYFSSTTEMKLAGGSGGEAGAAPSSSTPAATRMASIVRMAS